MKRGVVLLALTGAALSGADARAQGLFDIFGPDRPERAAPRSAPAARAEKAKKKAEPAKAKKGEAAKTQPDAAARSGASAADAPAPPYEPQLMRLSEVIGALAFLRDLCGDENGQKDGEDWRGKMSALIEAEAPSGPRREKYVAAFNRGFRGYELTYRHCTPNAKDAAARYLDEAAKISKDVSYRFGTP